MLAQITIREGNFNATGVSDEGVVVGHIGENSPYYLRSLCVGLYGTHPRDRHTGAACGDPREVSIHASMALWQQRIRYR